MPVEFLDGAVLIDILAQRMNMEPSVVGEFLVEMVDIMYDAFDNGAAVEIPGLGVYAADATTLDDWEQGNSDAYVVRAAAKKAVAKKASASKKAVAAKPTTKKTPTKKTTVRKVGSAPPVPKDNDPLAPAKPAPGRRKRTA